MGMKRDLVTRLLAHPEIAALVGSEVTWGDRFRGGSLPAITLLLVSPGRDYDHTGPTGEDEPRVQFDSWALTDEEADEVAKAIRNCMEVPTTIGDTRFEEGFLDGEATVDEGEQDGGVALFRVSQDYIFLHSPA